MDSFMNDDALSSFINPENPATEGVTSTPELSSGPNVTNLEPGDESQTNGNISSHDNKDSDDDKYYSDLDLSEIDEMLESGLLENMAKRQKFQEGDDVKSESTEFSCRKKVVLVEKNPNHFEVLPDGWITVTHSSGMPLYLHRTTRVCTLSKPYFLGEGSVRNHKIPSSAVPCLDYRRALENEKKQPANLVVNGMTVPHARVVTAQENDETCQLTAEDVRKYCSSLFVFKEIDVLRFSSWPARRKYHKKLKSEQRPTLPEGSKLIMCPIRKSHESAERGPTEWIMNPNGKTYVCILHDYVQRALKERPVYTFKELENTATPYLVSISINGVEYGKGLGSSKKLAKMEAAKATLDILIPGMKDKIKEDTRMAGRTTEKKQDTDLSFFDDISIDDPRVVEFCTKTTEPLPHAVLLTCLQRNFGLSETNIRTSMKGVKHGKNEFTLTVGSHTVTVTCQNKREGKQKASQALLQTFHPHIHSWGSLLRLYGNSSIKSFKEKKVEEQEITRLQSKGTNSGPNHAILNKLALEMDKLYNTRQEMRKVDLFFPPEGVQIETSLSTIDLSNGINN